jgi:hypothetical protein
VAASVVNAMANHREESVARLAPEAQEEERDRERRRGGGSDQHGGQGAVRSVSQIGP